MRIGVLFHGAPIFYHGFAMRLLDTLNELGSVKSIVSGPISRTACLDSLLHQGVEISSKKPSEVMKKMEGSVDLIILATYSKSPQSGYAYGWMILERSNVERQIEASNNTLVKWRDCEEVVKFLSGKLGCDVIEPPAGYERPVWTDGSRTYKRVLAVRPGEFIVINGFVVGKAKSDDVVIVLENGRIMEISGVDIKEHGLEKFEKRYPIISPFNMKIYSFDILYEKISDNLNMVLVEEKGEGTAYVDHSGYEIYAIACSCEGAISIGDDTTLITNDILARFKKPVLGVVDLDFDGIINNINVVPESEIIITKNDDKAGELIFREVFKGRNYINLSFDEAKEKVIRLLEVNNLLIKRGFSVNILREKGYSVITVGSWNRS
ncbi:MAG: DUF2117 domain-containing protein [Candidatus Korarchaeum sp.]|nr:DUF2117 domain-containing protein [Candidatus Korarchaeum sp.]